MSLAASPAIAWLKVSVNCVVVWVEEPLAVTLLKVTAVGVMVNFALPVLPA